MELKHLIKEDFVSVQKDESVSSMIGKLKEANERNALIFDGHKFLGLVEDKWLLKVKIDATKTKVNKFVKGIPSIDPEKELIDVAYLMYQSDILFLPVVKSKKVVGVINGIDLIKEASVLERIKDLKVRQIKLICVPELQSNDYISTAMSHMRRLKIWQLPVVENKKCVGLLSYRDILKKYLAFPTQGERSFKNVDTRTRAFEADTPEIDKLPISSFDTNTGLLIVDEQSKLIKAIEQMHQKDVSCAVVVKGGELYGLLTLKSILRKIASLKIPRNYNVQFIGLEKMSLENSIKNQIKEIMANEALKMQRQFKNDFTMSVHFKEYQTSGKRNKQKKYAVNMKLEYPGQVVSSASHHDTWDVIIALRKGCNDIKNELRKKLKGDSSHRKPYE